MRLIIILLILITSFSCKNENNIKQEQNVENPTTINSNLTDENTTELGEDIDEINAIAKNIYEKNGTIYVDIDIVQIKYKNIDERVIINENTKIRTYQIDENTLIYSKDCKNLKPLDLLEIKDSLLNDKSIILVGNSEKGKMLSINFGCYG